MPRTLYLLPAALIASGCGCNRNDLRRVTGVVVLPASVDFGEVRVGEAADRPIAIRNDGPVAVRIAAARLPFGSPFGIDLAPFSLESTQERSFAVSFVPSDIGPAEEVLVLEHDAGDPVQASLRGIGIEGCVDRDGDGSGKNCRRPDCDDANPVVGPHAREIHCNRVDDDCDAATLDVGRESCGNAGVDDDCDADATEIDPGVHLGDRCDSGGLGICRAGRAACVFGQLTCAPTLPGVESCGNVGTDDDCDGDAAGPELADGTPSGAACPLTPPSVATYACAIDVAGGSHTCTDLRAVKSVSLASGRGKATLDLAAFDTVRIEAEVCNPINWVLHLADSPTNDGWCGDGVTRSNDAEAWVMGAGVAACENDYGGTAHGGVAQTYAFAPFSATGCTTLAFLVRDGTLFYENAKSLVRSRYLFRFGAPDQEGGQPDWDLTLGLNRVASGEYRSGTGLKTVRLFFSTSVTCAIRDDGTTTCPAPFVRVDPFLAGRGTARVEMFAYRQMALDLDACDPTGYVLHVGDSERNRGAGEPAGDRTHDAELVLRGTDVEVWPDSTAAGRTPGRIAGLVPATGCSEPMLVLRNETAYAAVHKTQTVSGTSRPAWLAHATLNDARYLRLGAADALGVADTLWHLGFDRAVDDPSRTGSKLGRVTITLSDPDPTRCLRGGRTCSARSLDCVAVACP